MFGKLKFKKVQKKNILEITKRCIKKIYLYSFLCVCVLLLLPFTNTFNCWMSLVPDMSFAPISNLNIHMLDVGQGLCMAINLPNGQNIIIDTGDACSFSNVDRYIDKILLRGSRTLDYMIISHPDSDHAGNAKYILDKYQPLNVCIPKMLTELENGSLKNYAEYYSFYNAININKKVNIEYNFVGKVLQIDNVKFTWLGPNRDYYATSNDYSTAILIEYFDFSMLFTADIGHNTGQNNKVNTEMEVMNFASSLGIDSDIDVLQIAHHGSRYCTSIEFLEYFKPVTALISVGENSYGHPSDEVYKNILEYDNLYNKDLISNTHITKNVNNIIISVANDSNYVVGYIENVQNYLFISFVFVDLLFLAVALYKLLDYILGYIELRKKNSIYYNDKL